MGCLDFENSPVKGLELILLLVLMLILTITAPDGIQGYDKPKNRHRNKLIGHGNEFDVKRDEQRRTYGVMDDMMPI
jgi:hypothetical protein